MDTDGLGRRARQGGESSDEEHAPAPKRQKRHKFKNFAARVKDVRYRKLNFESIVFARRMYYCMRGCSSLISFAFFSSVSSFALYV